MLLATRIFRYAYKRVSLAIAATRESADKIAGLVDCPVVVHPQSAISRQDLLSMRRIAGTTPKRGNLRFLTVCRLEHWKAVDLAVRAFADVVGVFPDATLEIVGTGPEERRLRRFIRSLHLERNVRLLGRLPTQEDVYRLIAGSTALVHPALHESFGQVCLESAALGTQVICWDHGGPGFIASRCGLKSVPLPKDGPDVSGLSKAILETCSGKSGVPSLPDDFLWDSWCDTVESFLLKLRNLDNSIAT